MRQRDERRGGEGSREETGPKELHLERHPNEVEHTHNGASESCLLLHLIQGVVILHRHHVPVDRVVVSPSPFTCCAVPPPFSVVMVGTRIADGQRTQRNSGREEKRTDACEEGERRGRGRKEELC